MVAAGVVGSFAAEAFHALWTPVSVGDVIDAVSVDFRLCWSFWAVHALTGSSLLLGDVNLSGLVGGWTRSTGYVLLTVE